MLLLIAIVCSVIALAMLAIKPQWGILAIFIVRPLVDTAWDTPIAFGLKLTQIVSVAVPVIVLLHMASARGSAMALRSMPLRAIWLLWVLDIICFSGAILYSQAPLDGLDVFFRHLNGFVGFYMVQAYFAKGRPFRLFVIALLVAGMFPIGMGVFEGLTGHHWKLTTGADGVIRNIGLYHDAITIRYYALQTIMGVLLFTALYLRRQTVKRLLLSAYGLAAAFVVYGAYSKSGTTTLAAWLLLWPVLRKKMKTTIAVAVGGVLVAVYYGQAVYDRIGFIFHKEVSALQGTGDPERSFAGRWYLWEEMVNQWLQLGTLQQLLGSGQVAIGMHNDYLQILYHGGIVGLLIYLLLLTATGIRIVRNLMTARSALNVAALLALIMWLVDTIGLVPSAYPGYQWFVWGLIGVALRRQQNALRTKKIPSPKSASMPSLDLASTYASGWANVSAPAKR